MGLHYEGMLELVRKDIANVEPRVEKLKRLLEPRIKELEKLRELEAFLITKSEADKSEPVVATTVPSPSAPTEPTRTPFTMPFRPDIESVTPTQILDTTKSMLHSMGLGASVRAADIAKKLVPDYNHEQDNRIFENRIFSLICRKEWLTKIARGKFALTEYVKSSPELYPSLTVIKTA
jgi:hypothetical protein